MLEMRCIKLCCRQLKSQSLLRSLCRRFKLYNGQFFSIYVKLIHYHVAINICLHFCIRLYNLYVFMCSLFNTYFILFFVTIVIYNIFSCSPILLYEELSCVCVSSALYPCSCILTYIFLSYLVLLWSIFAIISSCAATSCHVCCSLSVASFLNQVKFGNKKSGGVNAVDMGQM